MSAPDPTPILAGLAALEPELEATWRALHREPELSLQEARTAARLAAALAPLGCEVTTGVGGHGVVGVLRSGAGPTVLLRTDMDALPVKEETGASFASAVTARDASGHAVPVMHACGHDAHMAAWLGAATLLARARQRWRGTVVLVAQPAEEVAAGAKAMIADGLLTRFPRPDHAVALHVTASLAAGQLAAPAGPVFAISGELEIVVRGQGGHGALPHLAIDPVLIAARVVVALQGIVAREVSPLEPAVITVGAIHGGTKANVIADEVTLQLTVRSYRDAVQRQLLAAIARVARGEALASGAPEPRVTVLPGSTPPVVNDPALAARLGAALGRALGPAALADHPPMMGSEDFAELGAAGIPSVLVWVGAAPDEATARAAREGRAPGTHSARFLPAPGTLRGAAAVLTVSALELLAAP